MPTSSITKSFLVSGKEQAETFAYAIWESWLESLNRVNSPDYIITHLHGADEIEEFMKKRGENRMTEKMLVTQALDERDLLVKKIGDKIQKATFTDAKKNNESKVIGLHIDEGEFKKEAQSAYQQIMDLVERYQKIDVAIVASNAGTMIQTTFGDYTVAGAISLRRRIRDNGRLYNEADFESKLLKKMEKELNECVMSIDKKNSQLESTAENMSLSILGKDSKVKGDEPIEVVNTYVKENTTVLIDPLNVRKKIEEINEKRRKLISELDTKIKVSNATTFIEI